MHLSGWNLPLTPPNWVKVGKHWQCYLSFSVVFRQWEIATELCLNLLRVLSLQIWVKVSAQVKHCVWYKKCYISCYYCHFKILIISKWVAQIGVYKCWLLCVIKILLNTGRCSQGSFQCNKDTYSKIKIILEDIQHFWDILGFRKKMNKLLINVTIVWFFRKL